MSAERGHLLIVDDNEVNRDLLSRRLIRQGHTVQVAANGHEALEWMKQQSFDVVLLDIMMPGMNGYEVLEHISASEALRHIPVIMISALDDLKSVVRCIEMGAEDYLFKPFNHVMLKARIGACLEKKRLRDQERAYLKQLELEQAKSEQLLLNILPQPIAAKLKQGQQTIADNFEDVTVLFADIVGFTELSARLTPDVLVQLLNRVFSSFDHLAETYGLEKIKTIGDAYLVVGGMPIPKADHVEAIANMALEMQEVVKQLSVTEFKAICDAPIQMRIGINTGPVQAGVIGSTKFSYDLWGDTVNTASRMESHGLPGRIQVAPATYERLKDAYRFEPRGVVEIKGKGEMDTYFLLGKQ